MASKVTATFESEKLTAAMRELSRISGRDFKTVVKAEAGKVLERASALTFAASNASIKKSQKTTRPEGLREARIASALLAR